MTMPNSPSVTAFAETAALFASLEGRTHDAHQIIDNKLPGEQAEFSEVLSRLLSYLPTITMGLPADVHRQGQFRAVRMDPVTGEVTVADCVEHLTPTCGAIIAQGGVDEQTVAGLVALTARHECLPWVSDGIRWPLKTA